MIQRDINGLVLASKWDSSKLESDREDAIQIFKRERMAEPLEAYLIAFDSIFATVEALMIESVDLSMLRQNAHGILQNKEALKIFRHLPGPPISEDDLRTLVGPKSLRPRQLKIDTDLFSSLVSTIMDGLDQRRFPWVEEARAPTNEERYAAIVATTALMATQQVATARRSDGKNAQEQSVRAALDQLGFIQIPSRRINNLRDAPQAGQYYGKECLLSGTKADIVVGLWDGRIMPIECKVSNSTVNSFKRLNHEATDKAETWLRTFGSSHVVPVAILSGVYSLSNLIQAQSGALSILWAHRLSDMTEWIQSTRP